MYMTPRKSSGDQSGLRKGSLLPPAPVDLVLVGVDRHRCRAPVQQPDALEQRVGVELVVVVEERDELARGRLERPVRRGGDALVRLAEGDLDPRVAGERTKVLEGRAARRSVVGEAELPVGYTCAAHRVDARLEPRGIRVVDGRDDRHERPVAEVGRPVGDASRGAADPVPSARSQPSAPASGGAAPCAPRVWRAASGAVSRHEAEPTTLSMSASRSRTASSRCLCSSRRRSFSCCFSGARPAPGSPPRARRATSPSASSRASSARRASRSAASACFSAARAPARARRVCPTAWTRPPRAAKNADVTGRAARAARTRESLVCLDADGKDAEPVAVGEGEDGYVDSTSFHSCQTPNSGSWTCVSWSRRRPAC